MIVCFAVIVYFFLCGLVDLFDVFQVCFLGIFGCSFFVWWCSLVMRCVFCRFLGASDTTECRGASLPSKEVQAFWYGGPHHTTRRKLPGELGRNRFLVLTCPGIRRPGRSWWWLKEFGWLPWHLGLFHRLGWIFCPSLMQRFRSRSLSLLHAHASRSLQSSEIKGVNYRDFFECIFFNGFCSFDIFFSLVVGFCWAKAFWQ